MCHSVDTGSGCKSLGSIHHVVGINDSHVREKLIICERILDTALFVGDDSERSTLRTCTCRCRDSDEVCLFAHLRECVYSLADIHEVHCHIHEVCIGMLVEYPHDLACVHSRAAAESDDTVGLKCADGLCAFKCAGKCRVGENVAEYGVLDAHLIELVRDRLCIIVLIKEAVCNDEALLLVHNRAELVKCNGHTAFLEVNLFGCSEPQHILSPLGNCLYIDKVLYAHVLGNAVSAP